MATRRLVILAAALFLLAAPRLAFPSTTYVVRKGDTLNKIAKRFHVSPEKIQAENGLGSGAIGAGDKLRIPAKNAPKRAASRPVGKSSKATAVSRDGAPEVPAVRAPSGPAQTHTVRRGDTLRSLSRRYDVPESDLRRLNRIRKGKAPRPGTVIVVRKALPETYTVEGGDSLFEIARKFGMETEELTARNNLESDHLTPGQQLVLFEREDDPAPVVAEAPTVATEEELAEAAQPHAAAQDSAPEPAQARLIRVAKKMLFTPYVWGGTSLTGLDCSGFVLKAFAMLNLELPRSAREQYQVGRNVDRDKLSIGDLVFFRTYAKYPSHVGIYLGDNRFIHASSGSRQVKISSMDHPYYEKRYIGAKRLLFGENDIVN